MGIDFKLQTGFQHCLVMILIQCHAFGLGRKTFEQSPKLLALRYAMVYVIIICCILSLYCISINYSYELVQSLKLLSVMAVIRMDDDDNDGIEKTLSAALLDSANAAVKDRSITTFDPLASSTWEEVIFGYTEVLSSEVYKFLSS